MKEKVIDEVNCQLFRRLNDKLPVLDLQKLEEHYHNHLKFKSLVKKVKPGFNNIYAERTATSTGSVQKGKV